MICNGTINLVSIVGVIIGLAISSLDQVTKMYILVFVGGNFVFIAADIWRRLFQKNNTFGKNLLEIIGFACGVGIMFLLLLL